MEEEKTERREGTDEEYSCECLCKFRVDLLSPISGGEF